MSDPTPDATWNAPVAPPRGSGSVVAIAIVVVIAVVVGAVIAVGITSSSRHTSTSTTTTTTIPPAVLHAQTLANQAAVAAGCPASPATRVNTLSWTSAPAMTINTSTTYYAKVVTTVGAFIIKLDAAAAPITVNNFVFLAEHNFYNCVIFHRVIPGFVIQGGDPTGTGTGGPGYTIKDEFPKSANPTYPLYSVAMANTGAPNSGGSQFFIVTGSEGETLPNAYSLFGQVVSGVNVITTINADGSPGGVPPLVTERMLRVTISTKE